MWICRDNLQSKKQDTHTCLVCKDSKEERIQFCTCSDFAATQNFEEGYTELEKTIEALDTSPEIITAVINSLNQVRSGTILSTYFFIKCSFEASQLVKYCKIKHIQDGPLFCVEKGEYSGKSHKKYIIYRLLKQSVCLWTITILKNLLLIRWDMWQFRFHVLHSLIGPTSNTSHHSLNY